MAEVVINDQNYHQFLSYRGPDGKLRKTGGIRRNFKTHPQGCYAFAPAWDLPIIPPSERQGVLDKQIADKATLRDVRDRGMNGQPIPSRDQDGKGYCWAHSSVTAMMIVRAIMNEPYVDLSAFAVACIIKHFQDEGGWGAESLEFIATRGVPTSEFWPQQSMSRANDNPKTWENAALHRFTMWRDLDPDHMEDQITTCGLLGYPTIDDYNWWSHSVCGLGVVSLNPYRRMILNSWGDSAGDKGIYILEGSKARPDACIAAICGTPSVN